MFKITENTLFSRFLCYIRIVSVKNKMSIFVFKNTRLMKFQLISISLAAFVFSLYRLIQRKENAVVVFFYLSWFLLFISLFIASDYEDVLSENIVSVFAVLFFVWLTLLPPILYGIIQFKLNKSILEIKHLYIPIVLFFINIFSLLYFSVQKDEKVFTYEVVENVMTYSNYIIILFIFPISTIYYSFLSYRLLKFFPSLTNFKIESEKGLLFLFVMFYDVYIFIWILTNYLISSPAIKSFLKIYYVIYFVVSLVILFRLNSKAKKIEIEDSDNSIFDEIEQKLNQRIYVDQVFLNPKVNLRSLAKEIGTNEKYLSQFINKNYNKNFSLFINEFRVEYAKKILLDDEYSNYTLAAIGSLSGFNSKTSFNSTFKKYTGETPSEYKNKKGAI